MVINWILNRIFTPRTLGFLVDKVLSDEILDTVADRIFIKLNEKANDPELQGRLIDYFDALFDRYKGKIFKSVGGSMKGLTNQLSTQGTGGFNIMSLLGGKSGKPNWLQVLAAIKQNSNQNQKTSGGIP